MERICDNCPGVKMKLIKSRDPNARKKVRCPQCGTQKGLSARQGRPPIPEHQLKKNRTLRLSDEVWERLGELGNGIHAAGIENLIKMQDKLEK